jgi:hypothetical protein
MLLTNDVRGSLNAVCKRYRERVTFMHANYT